MNDIDSPHPTTPSDPSGPTEKGFAARLGVDIGRVIIHGDGPDTSFVGGTLERALRAPAVAGAFASLTRLCARFDGAVWLVSKCGPSVESKTRAWLAEHRFFEATGIPRDHLVFCRTRPEKAPICRALGITCFVDDRADIITSMHGIVATRVLFGATRAPDPSALAAPGWSEAEAAALATLAEAE